MGSGWEPGGGASSSEVTVPCKEEADRLPDVFERIERATPPTYSIRRRSEKNKAREKNKKVPETSKK